jgi:uncharacterized membrane protein (DUF4010 family)
LWFVVVLVSGFSLAGYVATRLLGPARGALATAAAGAVVSSTAVTAAVATQLRDGAGSPPVHAAAIATASAVMFLRVMALTGLLAPFALPVLALLTAPGLVVSAAFAAWHIRRARRDLPAASEPVLIRNPFSLGPALLLMALVMVMTLVARWVLARFGDAGLAVVLAISGSIDVDSAIITMGGLPAGTLTPRIAGLVLLAPVVINSLFKAGVAVGITGWARGWQGALPLVLSALACLLAIPLA